MADEDVEVGLVMDADSYHIRVGEDVSNAAGFGEDPIVYDAPNGRKYIAWMDLPEGQEASDDVQGLLGDGVVYELTDTGAVIEDEGGDGDDGGGGEEVREAA